MRQCFVDLYSHVSLYNSLCNYYLKILDSDLQVPVHVSDKL